MRLLTLAGALYASLRRFGAPTSSFASVWVEGPSAQSTALSDAARARNRVRDATAIGYAPTPPAKHTPAKVTHVVLRFDSGASIEYPCDKPTTLTRPPSRVDLIAGVAYLDERQ